MREQNKPKEYAVKFLKEHLKKGEPSTECVRKLVKRYPKLTRPQAYYSAEEAGINILTARNTYDKMKKESH